MPKGDTKTQMENGQNLIVGDVLFLPTQRHTIMSAGRLKKFMEIHLSEKGCTLECAANVVAQIRLDRGLLWIDADETSLNAVSPEEVWRKRLAQTNRDEVQRLVSSGALASTRHDESPSCDSCAVGKATRQPLKGKATAIASEHRIHADVAGPCPPTH